MTTVQTNQQTDEWQIERSPVGEPAARVLLRAFFEEMVQTYHGRPARAGEVDAAMAADPSDDLDPPHGLFLVARRGGRPAGCLGLRHLGPGTAKLTRMFVHLDARGLGGGARLIAEMERLAAEHGVTTMRLGTRHDLLAARALYASLGYRETPPAWESASTITGSARTSPRMAARVATVPRRPITRPIPRE